MLFRFGQLPWWIGVAFVTMGVASSVIRLFVGRDEWWIGAATGAAIAVLPLAAAFVITGALTRPPRAP